MTSKFSPFNLVYKSHNSVLASIFFSSLIFSLLLTWICSALIPNYFAFISEHLLLFPQFDVPLSSSTPIFIAYFTLNNPLMLSPLRDLFLIPKLYEWDFFVFVFVLYHKLCTSPSWIHYMVLYLSAYVPAFYIRVFYKFRNCAWFTVLSPVAITVSV